MPRTATTSYLWAVATLILVGGGVVAMLLVRTRPKLELPMTEVQPDPYADALAEADESPAEMVAIAAGTFWMGRNDGPADEGPQHQVTLDAFLIDKYEVTNGQFAAFVKATGYTTLSEQIPDARRYPTVSPNELIPLSAVFCPCDAPLQGDAIWWQGIPGACWFRPTGFGSSVKGMKHYPAIHLAWDDAVAYAKWAGKRLPTEAEWEYAARGGLDRKEYCWGDEKPGTNGKWYANTWQGKFPAVNTEEDGFSGIAPVGSFPPNGYGLYDMAGNVWEWCADLYLPDYYSQSPRENPHGPSVGILEQGSIEPSRVRRGGSFLCADEYCRRYLPGARDKNPPDSSAAHTGFRCVK